MSEEFDIYDGYDVYTGTKDGVDKVDKGIETANDLITSKEHIQDYYNAETEFEKNQAITNIGKDFLRVGSGIEWKYGGWTFEIGSEIFNADSEIINKKAEYNLQSECRILYFGKSN